MDTHPVRRFRPDAGAPPLPGDVWPRTVPAIAQPLREGPTPRLSFTGTLSLVGQLAAVPRRSPRFLRHLA